MPKPSGLIRFTTVVAAVEAIMEERLTATVHQECLNTKGERVDMPDGNQISVRFSHLPRSPFTRAKLVDAIKAELNRRGTEGYTNLPVKAVRISRRRGLVTIIADPRRVDELQPHPTADMSA